MSDLQANNPGNAIAIVGLAGRFPGAPDIDRFWENLCRGQEGVRILTDDELRSAGVDPAVFNRPNYVRAKAVLEDVEQFDAAFFGVNPREAEIIDPQHRVFLECAWTALEHAGYDPRAFDGAIGVYAGASMNTYLLTQLINNPTVAAVGGYQLMLGNDKDFLPTRVSYKLNLTGPSLNIQTACSTSLVAVQQACRSLLNYECDMALAGGVSITVPHTSGYLYQEGMIQSPDGHCRAFDAQAQGTVSGEGVGIVVLKRLPDAVAAGDTIYAVIRGAAINNDGSLKVGYTAPSVDGQAEVIALAQAQAGIEADSISYVEAHGTGTALGDPIEIAALTQAFRLGTQRTGYCAIGSLKTNIGHLDAAAGVAGLIKTVLALKHKQLPPSLHFTQPNPKIDFANSPFYVNAQLADWPANGTPRRAGVSSFGIGGTNAHVVVEEAPQPEDTPALTKQQLIVLSARSDSALETATRNLADRLQRHSDINLADVAYTLQVGRRAFNHRRIVVGNDVADTTHALTNSGRTVTATQERDDRPVAFMFTGQGAQYVNMTRGLYDTAPTFRRHVDACVEFLKPQLGLDLREVLYPVEGQTEQAAQRLQQTALTQPALFVIEYALAQLWIEWGVQPQAMIGHSIGEYVAACLSGVFSLEEALTLVAARGRLMQSLPAGAMLAVSLPEAQVKLLLNPHLALAAVNAPNLCVMSGPEEAIDQLEQQLIKQDVMCRRLHTSHAFHSAMMEPILVEFVDQFKTITPKTPQQPFISNVTGTWITAAEAIDPQYWARHLRQTVRFGDGVRELLKQPDMVLLEVGPGQTLSLLARQQIGPSARHGTFRSLRHTHDTQADEATILNTLGQLWLAGVQIDWRGVHTHEQRRRIPLPTYPFERQRYWVDAQPSMGQAVAPIATSKRSNIDDWFYVPSWKRSTQPESRQQPRDAHWLVFLDECGVGAQLQTKLKQSGHVTGVRAGQAFGVSGDGEYVINLRAKADYVTLLTDLKSKQQLPTNIVHLRTVSSDGSSASSHEAIDDALDAGFYSLLFLAQAIGELDLTGPIQLDVISNGLHAVTGDEHLQPEKATVLGTCGVIPQEYPNIACRSIDVVLPASGPGRGAELTDRLAATLTTNSTAETVIAQRGSYRWVPTFEPASIDQAVDAPLPLKEQGVYMITGGLGGIGLTLAEELARTVKAKLVLIGRTPVPPRDHWSTRLAAPETDGDIRRRIEAVQSLEALGAEVLIVAADVTDMAQMQAAVAEVHRRFGAIQGVIHAAGLPGGGMIQLKTPETAERVMAPKVKGTLVLETVLRPEPLDFFVLCSSINSLLPMFGQVDYSAANAFMDAFAQHHQASNGPRYVSVNWGTWQQVGMAVNTTVPAQLQQARENVLRHGILPAEGQVAFRRILAHTVPQVIVSPVDFAAMLQRSLTRSERAPGVGESAAAEAARLDTTLGALPGASSLHPRPNLRTAFAEPHSELERTIAGIWQSLLGIQPIGLHDNFFELGGHSLLATQVVSRLRDVLRVELPLRSLFEATTVAELADRLETILWASRQHAVEANTEDREDIEL